MTTDIFDKNSVKLIRVVVIFSFFLFFSGCIQLEQSYEALEIDFLNVRTLQEGDWIEIDGVRFEHVKAFEDVEENLYTLPASNITRGAERRTTDYTEPFPSLNIGYMLATYITNINKDDSLMVEHNHTYKIIRPSLLHALGKLQFIRTDSTEIQIRTSSNYPAQISLIPLD